jgi:hypothetical protein
LARQNDVNEFSRNLPYTITSKKVSWNNFSDRKNRTMSNRQTLTLEFSYSWIPSYIEKARGNLYIKSNIIGTSVNSTGSAETFRFYKGMRIAEIELFLANITDEKVLSAIEQGRQRIREQERQRQLQYELFN